MQDVEDVNDVCNIDNAIMTTRTGWWIMFDDDDDDINDDVMTMVRAVVDDVSRT